MVEYAAQFGSKGQPFSVKSKNNNDRTNADMQIVVEIKCGLKRPRPVQYVKYDESCS